MKAKEIRRTALSRLEGNWSIAIAAHLFISIIYCVFNIGHILIYPLLTPGLALFCLKIVRQEKPDIIDLFKNYRSYLNVLVAYLVEVVIVFLGLLLFIVPGIIFAYKFSQIYYIFIDNPEISALNALKKSSAMMKGAKWRLFCLHLSFIGWILLCIITFGLALIWIGPYLSISNAVFYENLKEENKIKDDFQNTFAGVEE